jgi:hypothetical protein
MIRITEVEGEGGGSGEEEEEDIGKGMIGGEVIPGVYLGVGVEVGIDDLLRGKEDIHLLNQDPLLRKKVKLPQPPLLEGDLHSHHHPVGALRYGEGTVTDQLIGIEIGETIGGIPEDPFHEVQDHLYPLDHLFLPEIGRGKEIIHQHQHLVDHYLLDSLHPKRDGLSIVQDREVRNDPPLLL